MKFTGLTVVVAALAGLAAASPAPLVNGKLVCGTMKDSIVTCPFGQICLLAPGADEKSATGVMIRIEADWKGRWM
ncbi:hypothetical protein MKX08_008048 [Trichoderma sp. CBMAI-0020]|nr:hypothetical protein MKX08_008048 [Trichoderma sp. CBMAI-0020]WOD46712.1 hypothetical protein [Trichoderma atroviride]